jgi:hypothetical protein
MDKAGLLAATRQERARWDALIDGIDQARMLEPGVAGEWSVKDIVAHITWYERELVGTLEARALSGSELWQLPMDERNSVIWQENRDRPLHDVLAEAPSVFQRLLELLEGLSEEELVDPGRFPGMPSDWRPWQVISGITHEHYRDHIQDVRVWLERSDREGM